MSKLKKTANHTSELNQEIVEKEVTNQENKSGYFATAFDLAKALLAELPIVPTSDRVYELVQDIERGDYDDISPIENAKEHWEEYVGRTKEILRGRRILISRLKKTQK